MVYKLNGKKHTCFYRHSMLFRDDERDKLIEGIVKALSEDIATKLLSNTIHDAMKDVRFF
jgi:hypothetical protein